MQGGACPAARHLQPANGGKRSGGACAKSHSRARPDAVAPCSSAANPARRLRRTLMRTDLSEEACPDVRSASLAPAPGEPGAIVPTEAVLEHVAAAGSRSGVSSGLRIGLER